MADPKAPTHEQMRKLSTLLRGAMIGGREEADRLLAYIAAAEQIERALSDASEWSTRMAFRHGPFCFVARGEDEPPIVPWLPILESELLRGDELQRQLDSGEWVRAETLPTDGIAGELLDTRRKLREVERERDELLRVCELCSVGVSYAEARRQAT